MCLIRQVDKQTLLIKRSAVFFSFSGLLLQFHGYALSRRAFFLAEGKSGFGLGKEVINSGATPMSLDKRNEDHRTGFWK